MEKSDNRMRRKLLEKLNIKEEDIGKYKIAFHKENEEGVDPLYLKEKELEKWNYYRNLFGDRRYLIVFVCTDKNRYIYRGIHTSGMDFNFVPDSEWFEIKYIRSITNAECFEKCIDYISIIE